MSATPDPGSISWTDLTVADAEAVRNFYQAVVGWTPEAQPMGEYSDFVMSADGTPVAGICHARGENAAPRASRGRLPRHPRSPACAPTSRRS